jgi:biopolymer transport protein ExbB
MPVSGTAGGTWLTLWAAADGVGRATALVLLAMSLLSWVLIGAKGWQLHRARRDLAQAVPRFWAATNLAAGRRTLEASDRLGLLLPLVDAASAAVLSGTLQAQGRVDSQLTRRLRDAMHAVLARLSAGQTVLATIGSTAPFVGLFGTVWGVYRALASLAGSEAAPGIGQISGPIGEALLMTAAGIAVAVPALVAFIAFGRRVAACEAELEGFAFDLRELLLDAPATAPVAGDRRADA